MLVALCSQGFLTQGPRAHAARQLDFFRARSHTWEFLYNKKYTIIQAVRYTTYCYFDTVRPANQPTKMAAVLCQVKDWTQLTYHSLKPLKTKRRKLYLKTQFVPRSKQFSSQL